MWDLNQGDEPIQEYCGHELVVNGLAISPGTHTHTHTDRFHHVMRVAICFMGLWNCLLCSLKMGESCAPVHVTTGCACGILNLQNANTDVIFLETW